MPERETLALADGGAGTMTVSRVGGVGIADSGRPDRSGREPGGALRSGGLLGRAGDGRGSGERIGGAEGVEGLGPGRLVGGGEGDEGGFGEGVGCGGGEGEDGGFGEGAGCRPVVEPGTGVVLGLPGGDLSGVVIGETGLSLGRGDGSGCPLPIGFFAGLSGLEGAGLIFSSLGRVGLMPSLVLPGWGAFSTAGLSVPGLAGSFDALTVAVGGLSVSFAATGGGGGGLVTFISAVDLTATG